MLSHHDRHYHLSNRAWIFAVLITSVLLSVAALSPTAFADANLPSNGFGSETINIGKIIRRLGVAGGALGLAYSGIQYAIGSGAQADKAKSRMIMIGIAVAALLVLPVVVNAALSMFASTGWTP